MARTVHKLADSKLRALVRAGKPVPGISDGDGLTFTLSKGGTAAWVFRFRLAGKQREVTLGNYPSLSLTAARAEARELRNQVAKGVNVAEAKQDRIRVEEAKGRRLTFQALCEEWLARTVDNRVKHPKIVRRALARHVYPAIGSREADTVEPSDVDNVLCKIVEAGAPTVANHVLRYLKAVGSYGVKRRLLRTNPAADFTPADAGGEEKGRTRALSRDELAKFFAAMKATPTLGRENYLTFATLLATCVRKSELVAAKWSEFDLKAALWHLPGERTKTGESVDIPLAPPVVVWLEELRVFAAGSDYVLPARLRSKRFPHISPDTLNVALGRVSHGLKDFTIHDMRRTARTQLAALGVSREVAERALNHKLRDVEGIYNRHDYLDERRQALTLWADLLVNLESGKARSVVPIAERRKA